MSIELVMPFSLLILCCPLLLLSSIFTSIKVFSNESALHIRWPKYWSFSFNISIWEPRAAGVGEDGAGLRQGLGEGERRWNQETFKQVDKQNLVCGRHGRNREADLSQPVFPSSAVSCSLSKSGIFPVFSDTLVGWFFCHSVSDLALSLRKQASSSWASP